MESTFLAGKVVKKSLPSYHGPAGPDAPRLKRLLLRQGELAQFYDSEEGIRYMAMIELNPGSPRGNHYHKVKEEFVYVIEGKVELVAEDIATKEHAAVLLEPGDWVVIPTAIAHALRPMEKGKAIEFSKVRFALADVYPYPLA
jgi:quercetin dioxygenase-like cupin family protein